MSEIARRDAEIERLRELVRFKSAQIDLIREAVENKGIQPKYHDKIHKKHMKEWPTLWRAIYASWEELAQKPYFDEQTDVRSD
jgi:hypothetical protein